MSTPTNEPVRVKRECGGCTLCCKLIPVPPMNKVAGERCKHQRATGCAIYPSRPMECRAWHCKWLINDDAADLRRPDRAHYVIDMMPDFVTARRNEDGESFKIPVVQIWVDPKHPDAHRDPALRAWLKRRGDDGIAALIRYSATDGFALMPPAMSSTGDFIEVTHRMREEQHSFFEILAALNEAKP